MTLSHEQSHRWLDRAQQVIPGGVSSPVRAFSSVGGKPVFFVRGEGSQLTDVDGNTYVDLVGSWGPMILGHAHPVVTERVVEAVRNSPSFGAPTAGEVELAEAIIQRVPAAERVRFVSSGTEAVMTALRVARAATGRSLIVKFAGCYHGHTDAMLVQAGSGVATLGLPNSPGVTPGATADTIVLTYNDADSLRELFASRGSDIAAVITEPVPANMGVVPPAPGFNALIAELTAAHGALFILDEVMTGFRIGPAGWWGTCGVKEGWTPDLFTFGKVIGGGYPLAAVAGRAAVLDLLAPVGPVYQAGTLSGNSAATAAGLATLELCTPELYAGLDSRAIEVGNIISDALTAAGVAHQLQRAGNLFSVFFTAEPVTNFDDAKAQDTQAFGRFFHAMLENGVSLPPSAFEAWFVSAALTDADLETIRHAATIAAAAAARA